jgi:hypothetical protein
MDQAPIAAAAASRTGELTGPPVLSGPFSDVLTLFFPELQGMA